MVAERHDAVLRQLELFRALAEENEREQQLGSFTVYAYHSLGEWLATAVQLGFGQLAGALRSPAAACAGRS